MLMNRFFRKLPLLAKLMLIALIPFGFLLYLTEQVYDDQTEKLKLLDNYKNYIEESANINSLIDALQEERKFSFDYAITRSNRKELVLQRPKTDALLQKIIKSGDVSIEGLTSFTKLGELNSIRNKIDSFTIKADGIMHFYSNTVFRLNTLNTIPPANTAYLDAVYNDLVVQKILSEMITYLGIIRSNIYNVLHTRQYMIETLIGTIGTHDVFQSYEAELRAKGAEATIEQYENLRNTTALKPTMAYVDSLFKRFAFDSSYTAADWWKISDEGVNALRTFQADIWSSLHYKLNGIYQEEKNSRSQTLLFLIAALVSIIAVVAYIVFIISRSLRKLKYAAEKISNGETSIDIRPESNDVIGSLAKSISKIDRNNQLLANAAVSIGQGDFSVKVEPRSAGDILGNAIAEMKKELEEYSLRMEELVVQRTKELARSNEDLQQFAHVASHDLKEPLRKISTFSSILSSEQKDSLSEKGKLYLQKIEHSSQRMSNMIEGVLAYSTVSANEQSFEIVDLNKLMEEVENDLELAIIQKEAKIEYGQLPKVKGIRILLHQLFYNLINNALKFSKDGVPPSITIKSSFTKRSFSGNGTSSDYVQIIVSDNGIGFNPVFEGRIFGVFSRLNARDKYEGTGLGLALCKKIVQRHGGEISAEGKEGIGASFRILLPAD